ncbi:peptide-methionine (R)-S-oxide reductase, partial [Acinetobacter baumannii]
NGREVWARQGYVPGKDFYQALGRFKLGRTEAYDVAFRQGTDSPFCRQYDLFRDTPDGVFVDKLSGVPLFDTRDRFNSGTGWLSFTRAIAGST